LEGHRWAQLGEKAAWCTRVRSIFPSRRAASTLLIVLLLLAPYGSSLFLLLGRDSSSCGMQCCKGTKACCCRKSSHKAHEDGATWASSSKCPDGCGQAPAIQGMGTVVVETAPFYLAPPAAFNRRSLPSDLAFTSAPIEFALFARPPPSLQSANHSSSTVQC
jgi:hypothetical protein